MADFAAFTVAVLSLGTAMVIGEAEPALAVALLAVCAACALLLWRRA